VEQLHHASRLIREPQRWRVEEGAVLIELDIPPHAVAAVTLTLGAPVSST